MRNNLKIGVGIGALVSASGPSEPVLGPELFAQPELDSATGLTATGWLISGGQADSQGNVGFCRNSALFSVVAGQTFRIECDIVSNNGGRLNIGVAENVGNFTGTGTKTLDWTATMTVPNSNLGFRDLDEVGIVVSRFSVRQLT